MNAIECLKVLVVLVLVVNAVFAGAYWTKKIQDYIRNRQAIRDGIREARRAEHERVAKVKQFKATEAQTRRAGQTTKSANATREEGAVFQPWDRYTGLSGFH